MTLLPSGCHELQLVGFFDPKMTDAFQGFENIATVVGYHNPIATLRSRRSLDFLGTVTE